ncbi:hypothetical protein, partial [Tateyamaria sp.]|uniref:hypothetical protein n=1 Tax=Tateyamaria sp. TaxID=1929288 RepID=UPI003282860B
LKHLIYISLFIIARLSKVLFFTLWQCQTGRSTNDLAASGLTKVTAHMVDPRISWDVEIVASD